MGNILGSVDTTTALKTSVDLVNASQNKALSLDNGDTAVKQKLTVSGVSTFNDNVVIAPGKTINSVDIGVINSDVTKLKTDVSGISSGDFTGKAVSGVTAITSTGLGTFSSVKTSDIDINGNITSSTGKKYIVGDSTGTVLTNGLLPSDPKYAFQKFETSTGDIQLKTVTNGGKIKLNNITINNDTMSNVTFLTTSNKITGGSIQSNGDIDIVGASNSVSFGGVKVLNATNLKYGTTTELNASSLIVPNVTSTSINNTGDVSNTGSFNNRGAIKIGTNKWLINEVDDAVKGKRLCFGMEDTSGRATYWTCMNNRGNLELA